MTHPLLLARRSGLPFVGCALMLLLAGCGGARVPFEQGSTRYEFDVRAERDLGSGRTVGTASVTDLATDERLTIDRFEAPGGETSEFLSEDAATGARLELEVTPTDGEVLYVATVRKGNLLIASQSGAATLTPPAR